MLQFFKFSQISRIRALLRMCLRAIPNKKIPDNAGIFLLEERMGFEPTSELPRYSISNAAPSTTRTPLRNKIHYTIPPHKSQ